MVEQLQLFDPTDYVGVDGNHYIEIDLDDTTVKWYQEEAARRGITFDELVNMAIKNAFDLTCPTCRGYRRYGGECPHCGELDH